MNPHPFQQDPRKIVPVCVCGKSRTHSSHLNQGEIASTEVPADLTHDEPTERPTEEPPYSEPIPPSDYFLIESHPDFTEVSFRIPGGDRLKILSACTAFLEAVKEE